MKRLPYDQMVLELDKLFFGGKLENLQQAEDRAETIEAYLEACGWNWDLVLQEMGREETVQVQRPVHN